MNMVDIDYAAFRRLDLNLLVAFDALVSEASVSRAAARLFVGQPAMSHALARLRETFGDDILFRDGAGMRPTPRALALAGAVRQVLDDIQHLARGARAFDPAEAEGRVRIALTDPLEALLLPGLVARLRARAPGLILSVLPIPASRQLEQLDAGAVTLVVGHFPQLREVHEGLVLHESGFSCVFNPALIHVPAGPSLADLAGLPHIHTNYVGEPPGLVDRVFTAQGLSRQVVARSAMPLSIPFVLKRSPLVAILPDMLARMFLAHVDLRFEPLRIEGLSLPISLVRHRRERSDPLTGFVAGLLADSVAEWVAAGG